MINENCNLVLRDLFSYDIVAAYPTIMNNMNWDFGTIDLDNKEERNIYIGKSQINNTNLSSFLINSAESLVQFYLKDNNVNDEDIIITQRDGFIIKKMLQNDDQFINMKYREHIDYLIISIDRSKYLSVNDDKVTVKGISHLYPKMFDIYNKFISLNFFDKKVLFNQLDDIKKSIVESQDKELFMIPHENKFVIMTKRSGQLLVQDSSIFSVDDINRYHYYHHYINSFLKSIFLECY